MVLQYFQGDDGIQFGVVRLSPLDLAVLVVFDQVVVGIAWEGEGVQPEGVDDWEFKEFQVWSECLEVWDVEGDDVMAD